MMPDKIVAYRCKTGDGIGVKRRGRKDRFKLGPKGGLSKGYEYWAGPHI